MLTSFRNSGFQLSFENGYTVSVQFGSGNYCSNYNAPVDWKDSPMLHKSPDAEVAVMLTANGDWYTKEVWSELFKDDLDDDVVGYVNADDVAKVIAYVQQLAVFKEP